MVIEEHEMSIRLEMFFVQFDSLLRQHVSFPHFFLSYLLSFFSHILHQWYFLYLRITGQNKTQTNPSPIPLQLGSLERRRYNTVGVEEEKQQHINIFVDDSHCFSGETTCSVRWETGNMQGFHLDLTYSGGGA